MAKKRKDRTIWSRLILIAAMVGLSFWSYKQFVWNYNRIDMTYSIIQSLLVNQATLVKVYEKEIAILKASLQATEVILADTELENKRLQQKIVLLDRLTDLERAIAGLKAKNAQIISDMVSIREQEQARKVQMSQIIPPLEEELFDTVEGGKTLLAKYRNKVHKIKQIIKRIKKDDKDERIVIFKEEDQKKLLLGNNGYLVKNGVSSPPRMLDVLPSPNHVSIKVEFVK